MKFLPVRLYGLQQLSVPYLTEDDSIKLSQEGNTMRLALAVQRECEGKSSTEILPILARYVEQVRKSIGCQYFLVTPKPGKTERSRTIVIKTMDESEGLHESRFYVPASLCYYHENCCYLPRWFVLKALEEVRLRGRYKVNQWRRIPVAKTECLQALLLAEACRSIIPPDYDAKLEDFIRLQEKEEQERAIQRERQLEQHREQSRLERAKQIERDKLREENDRLDAAKKLAKIKALPTTKNVTIIYKHSVGDKRNYKRVEERLSDVTLRISGARVYVFEAESDTLWFITHVSNITVLSTETDEIT